MSSITTRKFVAGFCGLSMAGLGVYALWVNKKALLVEERERGSLLDRMEETAQAALRSITVINNKEIADQHVDLVSRLSASPFADDRQAWQEVKSIENTYYSNYLLKKIERLENRSPLIFRYSEYFPYFDIPRGFIYSGIPSQIHDRVARRAIIKGKYVRCKLATHEGISREIIVTGTRDGSTCALFQNHLLKNIIWAVSNPNQSRVDYSLSLTYLFKVHVLEESEEGFKLVGNLANIPETLKKTIHLGNYVLCNHYCREKNSEGFYEEIDAIVAGTQFRPTCEKFHFAAGRKFSDSKMREKRL